MVSKRDTGEGRSPSEIERLRARVTELEAALEGRERIRTGLSRTNAELRAIIDALPDAILRLGLDGTIGEYKSAPQTPLLVAPKDFLGRKLPEVLPEPLATRVRQALVEVRERGGPLTIDFELPEPQSPPRHFEARLVLLHGSQIVCIVRDVTGRKQAEDKRAKMTARLKNAEKIESLAALAGGIAHDFNNLLTGVMGNASIIRARLGDDRIARRSLVRIEQAAWRGAALARQMLAYSGRGHFVLKPLNLSELVERTCEMTEPSISPRAVVTCELMPDLPAVVGDGGQISEALMAVIKNASEALPGGEGRIKISTGVRECSRAELDELHLGELLAPDLYVYVAVEDVGNGMDPELQGAIFDPFFSTKFVGRGLGLAATLGIVRGHRGAIGVESTPGEGTTIRLLFPASERRQAARPDPTLSDTWRGRGSVLVVENDGFVREVATQTLARAGFDVASARDGVEALKLFRKRGPAISVVLLDLVTPRIDGLDTYRELRELAPELPILLTSGYSEENATQHIEGHAGFLHKPYMPRELLAKVREVIAARPNE